MEFDTDEDHPSETELKLQIVRIYNWKLTERNSRKHHAIDRGLVDTKRQQLHEKKLSKDDRELVSRLRVFSRLQSVKEHEALVDGILRAKKLRSQIELLHHYRKMGLKSLDQIRRYENDRKKREADQRIKNKSYLDNFVFETSKSSSQAILSSQSKRRSRLSSDAIPSESIGTATEDNLSDDKSTGDENGIISILDLSRAPYVDLLTPTEVEFCSKVPILPLHYLAAKETITRYL